MTNRITRERETLNRYCYPTRITHARRTADEVAEIAIDDIVARLKVGARYSGNGLPELQEALQVLFENVIIVRSDDDRTIVASRGLTYQ